MASTCGRRGPTHSDWEGSHPGAGRRHSSRAIRTIRPVAPSGQAPVRAGSQMSRSRTQPGDPVAAHREEAGHVGHAVVVVRAGTRRRCPRHGRQCGRRSIQDVEQIGIGCVGVCAKVEAEPTGTLQGQVRGVPPRWHRRRVRRSSARPSRGRRLGRTSPSRRTARAPDGRRRRPREYRRLSVPCPRYHPPITRPTRTSTGLQAW